MSGVELVEMLKRVNHPIAHKLDPKSLDWAFVDPAALPFMQWVCSIGQENILTEEEQKKYDFLVSTGDALTNRVNLDKALEATSQLDDGIDESNYEAEIEELEKVLQQAEEKRAQLQKENTQLELQQLYLNGKLSKVEDLSGKAKSVCEETRESLSLHSVKLDDAIHKLAQSVKNLTDLYTIDDGQQLKSGTRKKGTASVFLSKEDLSQLHRAEERFSQDLTAFTKKRFFEGVSDIAGEKDKSQYSILDVSNPENVSMEATEDDAFQEDCLEFSLLQQIFPQSEINRLNALVNTKRAISAVHEAKNILHLLKSEQFPSTPASVSQKHLKAEDQMRSACAEAAEYVDAIPDLIHQLGALQGTEILTGDYDLKLKRQSYFTKNQDKVIEHLECQRSRSELLIMLYELELRFHERTHHLLCATEKTLQKHLQDWHYRMKCYDDPDLSSMKFERNVVDSRDVSSNRVFQMTALESAHKNSNEQDLYLPLDKVKMRAELLHSTYQSTKASSQDCDKALEQNMSALETCVKDGQAYLYAESSTSSGLPNLSPARVQASMTSLQSHISSLRSVVDKVATDIRNKKKLLKGNPILCKEKELFTWFHTKPDRLVSVINEMEEKLKIQGPS